MGAHVPPPCAVHEFQTEMNGGFRLRQQQQALVEVISFRHNEWRHSLETATTSTGSKEFLPQQLMDSGLHFVKKNAKTNSKQMPYIHSCLVIFHTSHGC